MEQSSLTVIQDDLSSRSKKALTLGILSVAIPSVLIILNNIIYVILALSLGIGAGMLDSRQSAIRLFALIFIGYFSFFIVSGVIMMILGKGAWNRVRTIRQDAIRAGVRRPAVSFVAQVFGISSFFSGLFLVIVFAVYFLILGLIFIAAGLMSL